MRNPPFQPATSFSAEAAFAPGHPLPPGTCEPACSTKRTAAGSNRAANAATSPANSMPGPDGFHASGAPTGAESTYAGSLVAGIDPDPDDPGATGTCFGAAGDEAGA